MRVKHWEILDEVQSAAAHTRGWRLIADADEYPGPQARGSKFDCCDILSRVDGASTTRRTRKDWVLQTRTSRLLPPPAHKIAYAGPL